MRYNPLSANQLKMEPIEFTALMQARPPELRLNIWFRKWTEYESGRAFVSIYAQIAARHAHYDSWFARECLPATFASELKYGSVACSGKVFYPSEPIFIFRPTDLLSVDTIGIDYALRCNIAGCSDEYIKSILEAAERMQLWQKANPGLVKGKPD